MTGWSTFIEAGKYLQSVREEINQLQENEKAEVKRLEGFWDPSFLQDTEANAFIKAMQDLGYTLKTIGPPKQKDSHYEIKLHFAEKKIEPKDGEKRYFVICEHVPYPRSKYSSGTSSVEYGVYNQPDIDIELDQQGKLVSHIGICGEIRMEGKDSDKGMRSFSGATLEKEYTLDTLRAALDKKICDSVESSIKYIQRENR